jgi:hypothetical protein
LHNFIVVYAYVWGVSAFSARVDEVGEGACPQKKV